MYSVETASPFKLLILFGTPGRMLMFFAKWPRRTFCHFPLHDHAMLFISGARASSEYMPQTGLYSPEKSIDQEISKMPYDFLKTNIEDYPWLELSIPEDGGLELLGIEIITRFDCCEDRLQNVEIRAGMDPVPRRFTGKLTVNKEVAKFAIARSFINRIKFQSKVSAKYVTIQKIGYDVTLEINEVVIIVTGIISGFQVCSDISTLQICFAKLMLISNYIQWDLRWIGTWLGHY